MTFSTTAGAGLPLPAPTPGRLAATGAVSAVAGLGAAGMIVVGHRLFSNKVMDSRAGMMIALPLAAGSAAAGLMHAVSGQQGVVTGMDGLMALGAGGLAGVAATFMHSPGFHPDKLFGGFAVGAFVGLLGSLVGTAASESMIPRNGS